MEGEDPRFQFFNITAGDGTVMPVSMAAVDDNTRGDTMVSISYGTQIGVSLMMLLVVLVMNPTVKLLRVYTAAQIAALVTNTIRMIVLSLFFSSQWNTFYALNTGDFTFVLQRDYNISIFGNILSLIVVVLVELCLIMQAWTMVTMWPTVWKWISASFSAALSLAAIGFRFAFCILQSQSITDTESARSIRWVASTTIIIGAGSIFWYCALFNVQLVAHLVKNRSFLPDTSGFTPMEALVFSNGILMIVPGKRHKSHHPFFSLHNSQVDPVANTLCVLSRLRKSAVARICIDRGRLLNVYVRRRHPPAGHPGCPPIVRAEELQPFQWGRRVWLE